MNGFHVMSSLKKVVPCLALTVMSVAPVWSAEDESGKHGFWSIQVENDLFSTTNEDRFYTNGVQFSHVRVGNAPEFMQKAANLIPFYEGSGGTVYGFSIGQKIYTPEDTEVVELIEDDRPYAGWLYSNFGMADVISESDNGEQVINGLVLTLGVVGPASLAEQTQREWHKLIDVDVPKGWDNQLENELGVNLTYIRKWRKIFPLSGRQQFEISRHGALALGNVFTYAAGGVMARWGTHLDADIGPPNISPGFPGIPAFKPNPKFNWYLFAGIEGRAMARNIFLDGNTFSDSHSVDKRPLVGDMQVGLAFHYKGVRLAVSNMFRTKEFDGQTANTNYGAVNLTFHVADL